MTPKKAGGTRTQSAPEKRTKKETEGFRISEMDQYLFGQGTHYEIYKKLGAHTAVCNGKTGVSFAVWAPHAAKVSVIGEFNGWNGENHEMRRLEPLGIYELFVPEASVGMMYKYQITTQSGDVLDKADPYGYQAELRPGKASIVADIDHFHWSDGVWMKKRSRTDLNKKPMAIYEMHPGSWKKHWWFSEELDNDGFYNYRELAHALVEYVEEAGYTHVEMMGLAEHPFDGSWGYQVTQYFAPTARYGTPEDFQYFVNYLHRHNIGIIMDWVPAHFPRDAHGLADFDGSHLYEYDDPRKGEHPDWGTKIFDYGKPQVKNFLISNALFWVEKYHIDGLRVDAVASMLYLDYGKQDGQWVPNQYGGNENLEAIEFFKHLNSCLLGRNPGAVMIAEESTAWPKVTGAPEDGGLGFSMKWNMGWMHDFLEYMKLDPYFRKNDHYGMTFAMSYHYSEKYILSLSHDEVVHLKCSMINKMPGEMNEKFANLRAAYGFMFGHPGKKLLFMGQEFGQLREWSEKRELDWGLLEDDRHRQLFDYFKELLALYRRYPCMYELDYDPAGFEWVSNQDANRSIYTFIRHGEGRRHHLLFVCSFTPVERKGYQVGVPKRKEYTLVLNSDEARFGGSGAEKPQVYQAARKECDGQPYSFSYDLPPYGIAVFRF